MTRHISYSEFLENLSKYMDEATSGSSVHIKRDDATSVVMISEGEFESWMETIQLLRNPANAARLLSSIQRANAGKLQEHGLIEE